MRQSKYRKQEKKKLHIAYKAMRTERRKAKKQAKALLLNGGIKNAENKSLV